MHNQIKTILAVIRASLRGGSVCDLFRRAFQFLTWLLRYISWRLYLTLGPKIGKHGLPPVTVVLLSYQRPYNMAPIVRCVLKCGFVSKVILSNNNPEINLREHVRSKDPRLNLIQQKERKPCLERFKIAREVDSEYFLAFDDDLFLYPKHIKQLYQKLLAEPNRPHGIAGSVMLHSGTGNTGSAFDFIKYQNREVTVLNRVYAFTGKQVSRYFELVEAVENLNLDTTAMSNFDDVFISHSGEFPPKIHAIGPYIPCPSGMHSAISAHGADDFHNKRGELVKILDSIVSFKRVG